MRVASVTGGASYNDERRAFARGPALIVGTPGRLLEHLQRGTIDASGVGAVSLDEADRLLDLGFREDLEAILAFPPADHRTHLVSATFPREVRALADKTQKNPAHVEGTRLGAANADIDPVIHLVDGRQRVDAIVNLLLAHTDGQTLVFARTRADVADITAHLKNCGFTAMSLSGEMDQVARNRALAGFKDGNLRVLVATDVAARGIDVQDIAWVIHAEPPTDADTYTHRSGRTGRAGRKGTSCILASPPEVARTMFLLQRAGVQHRFEAIPSAASIRAAATERAAEVLLKDDVEGEPEGFDDLLWALAKRIATEGNVPRSIARLLARTEYAGPTEPRNVRVIEPPTGRGPSGSGRSGSGPRPGPSRWRNDGPRDVNTAQAPHVPQAPRDAARPISRGPASHGSVSHGPVSRGPVSHGPVSHGPVSRGPASRGPSFADTALTRPTSRGPARGPGAGDSARPAPRAASSLVGPIPRDLG